MGDYILGNEADWGLSIFSHSLCVPLGRWEPGVPQPEGKWLGKDYPKRRHEAQGEGRDSPAEIWNQTKRNARAKAVHWAGMNAVSKGRTEGGEVWR